MSDISFDVEDSPYQNDSGSGEEPGTDDEEDSYVSHCQLLQSVST